MEETHNEAGELHSFNDKPAAIDEDGSQEWYKNGKMHRLDGPALIWSVGTQYWCRDGEFHREDGPAITYANGEEYWYINSTGCETKDKFMACARAYGVSEETLISTFLKYTFK